MTPITHTVTHRYGLIETDPRNVSVKISLPPVPFDCDRERGETKPTALTIKSARPPRVTRRKLEILPTIMDAGFGI